MSTTDVGNQFRDRIAGLLQAAGYGPTTEILEGHKAVDVVFERIVFGKRMRYALEAKNWDRPLNHSDLQAIYGGYASLLKTGKIDQLLIVAPKALKSPAASAFVRDTPGVLHQSFNEFQESVLGFTTYLSAFVHSHERDGLEHYFVQPALDDGTPLETYVSDWAEAEGMDQMAIIAGYGMGKTSFANHLGYGLAKRFLAGNPCRIPVLVSVGNISREQSLEGLIGSVLAGGAPSVTNYNFPLFSALNALGRFLILLDGFDEMKHMMTQAEFESNFDELNRLATGQAKVILLGRPTAFLSEDERAYALRGTTRIGKAPVRTPGAPRYREIVLRPFSPKQVREFVRRYLAFHQTMGHIDASSDLLRQRQ